MTDPNAPDRPWLSSYPEGVPADLDLAPHPVHELLERSVRDYGDRPCIDFLGRRMDYAEVGERVERFAAGLRRLGVEPGTRVGLFLPNCPLFPIAYFAILRIGGVVVNFNPLYADREVQSQIEDAGVRIAITVSVRGVFGKLRRALDTTCLEKIVVARMSEMLPTAKGLLYSIFKRSQIADVPERDEIIDCSTVEECEDELPALDLDPLEDIAVLQYTGGTTGLPKAAMLTHANIVSNTEQVTKWFCDMEWGKERVLGVLPLFHVFAMTVVQNMSIRAGLEMVLLPRFELAQLLSTIQRKEPTVFPGVPTIYNAICDAEKIDKYELDSVKYCISGGAPLPVDVKERFEKLTGCVLVEGYGLTETSPVVSCNPLRGDNRTGSIGLPLPSTDISLRDLVDGTEEVATGERGELWVRGPQCMKGYWNRPQETEVAMQDGWVRTGDIGILDPDGYLSIVDRKKDLILVNGYNVYPRMVEEAIYLHPDVVECIVLGVEDERRGERPKAYMRLTKGSELTREELAEFLEDKLSPIEMPRELEFRAELPKTLVGKLCRKTLAEEEAKAGNAGA